MGILYWPVAALTIRSQVLTLRERPYIELAEITNLNSLEVIFKEILPNLLPYFGTLLCVSIVVSMAAEAGLEILGFGPVGISTIGMIINWAWVSGAISMGAYNWILPPIIFLIWLFVSLNLINFGLDDIYNPRLKKTTGM
jgi:peptide/nickel transport system permease protein